MVTIKEVAREANVAISTVSNVLNNVDVVKQETREKVLVAVRKLNYTPNLNGKYLKKMETKMLGLFITTLEGAFYSDLVSAMYSQCCKHDYNLTIFLNSEKNLKDSYQAILGKRVDGAIILNNTIKDSHIEIFKKLEMPIVFLDREVASETIVSVVIDNYNGVKKATEYLINTGHEKIGYIHGIKDNYDEQMRYHGYVDALKEKQLTINTEWNINGEFSQEISYQALTRYLQEKKELPKAFVCANDEMAIGTMEALRDANIKVPQDISVIGFDNIEKTNYFVPKITTVDASAKELGRTAVDCLIGILNKETVETLYTMNSKLMIRESCCDREQI